MESRKKKNNIDFISKYAKVKIYRLSSEKEFSVVRTSLFGPDF
jgi:hypothetical protein